MGRHSLIIGGTRGIGRALVEKFARQKHTLSVLSRRLPADSIPGVPQNAYWRCDLLDDKKLKKTLHAIVKKNGSITNLVFFQRWRGEKNDWEGEIETSLTATKRVVEQLAGHFDSQNFPSIVMVSSVASRLVASEQPLSYHVGKGGLEQMIRYYAATLGAQSIRVNSVSFGTVLKRESKKFYEKNKKLTNLYKKIIPLGRIGTAEEMANVIAFLCSPEASFITGQNIIVDGGITLQWHESLARRITNLNKVAISR